MAPMSTQNPTHKKTPLAQAIEFAGFGDWFEIFIGGRQVDSQGREHEFTTAELDSVVANFEPATVPMVIGHPKTTAPAYGWLSAVKREGNKLFAQASDVISEFEEAVKKKMFPKRSISIVPDGNGGFRLRHLGWLGAVPPAVKGLADLQFQSDDSDALEFVETVDGWDVGHGFGRIGRVLRGLRDWLIETTSIEAADRILPDYDITSINELAERMRHSAHGEGNAYSQAPDGSAAGQPNPKPKETDTMPDEKTYTEEEVAALRARLEAAEAAQTTLAQQHAYQQRLAEATTLVQAAVQAGTVTPAAAQGMADFMAALPDGDGSAFEYAEGDGKASKTPAAFFKALLAQAKPVMQFGTREDDPANGATVRDFAAPDGFAVDDERAALHGKALQYQEQHGGSYADAVFAVSRSQ